MTNGTADLGPFEAGAAGIADTDSVDEKMTAACDRIIGIR